MERSILIQNVGITGASQKEQLHIIDQVFSMAAQHFFLTPCSWKIIIPLSTSTEVTTYNPHLVLTNSVFCAQLLTNNHGDIVHNKGADLSVINVESAFKSLKLFQPLTAESAFDDGKVQKKYFKTYPDNSRRKFEKEIDEN